MFERYGNNCANTLLSLLCACAARDIAVVWSVILSVSLLGGSVNIRSACIESWLAFDEIEPVF